MNVGEKIKAYLFNNKISQLTLSSATGIAAPKLNMALNGNRKLTLEEYERICGVLGVEVGMFLTPIVPVHMQDMRDSA